ncbi:hypothetical protein HKX48_005532, partial [Thoreauomyces humboldtii]
MSLMPTTCPPAPDSACDPDYSEPNVALMLEICDLIVSTGKNLPREAAFAITRNINSRTSTGAMHALLLLDYCVKNCGYPFHLIISTKEFLNELVRRFPEKPTNISMVHHRILELIQQWNATLCATSRYKEDFKHINDMFRLLSYKGYRLPPLSKEAIAQLNPEPAFQTAEELEEEDKVAHGAKLTELLRIGTPAALERANDLMKIMSGYDTDRIPDYTKHVQVELDRIEQRAIALNDLLISKREGDRFTVDERMEELVGSTKSAQTRIRKLVEDGDEDERMERLLELNDLINTVLIKHDDYKAGKPITGALAKASPAPTSATSSHTTSPTASSVQPVASLIDLDDWGAPGPTGLAPPGTSGTWTPTAVTPSTGGPGMRSLMDDLGDLNFGTAAPTSSGANGAASRPPPPPPAYSDFANFAGGDNAQPASGTNTPGSGPRIALHSTGGSNAGFGSMQSAGANLGGLRPQQQVQGGGNVWGAPSMAGGISPVQEQFPQKPADPFGGIDLFGKLAGIQAASSNTATPFQSLPGTPPATPAQQPQQPSIQSSPRELMLFDKNGLQIKLRIAFNPETKELIGKVSFVNVTTVKFDELNFMLAVTKNMKLAMEPASGTVLEPLNQGGVTQGLRISNPLE